VSNSEASSNAGVGSITFDQFGNVTGYERLQSGTIRNCGGGKTFWNTWITCEETASGHVWVVDPFAKTARRTLLSQPYQAPWESAAYDNRDPSKPTFYVTADKSNGALLRFTPSAAAVATARATNNYSQLLHTAGADVKWEYLVLTRVTATSGTFLWTTNVATAEASAGSIYRASEGIGTSISIVPVNRLELDRLS
jgi:secreted PhoX family phosphatase